MRQSSRYALALYVLVAAANAPSACAQTQPLDRQALARSADDRNVLVSARHHLAWYVGGFSLKGRTLADIEPLCESVHTAVAGPWRAPTISELATLVHRRSPYPLDQTLNLWDTPDRQLFGRLLTFGDAYVQFRATDFQFYVNGLSTTRWLKVWGNGSVTSDTGFAKTKGDVTLFGGDRLICVSRY